MLSLLVALSLAQPGLVRWEPGRSGASYAFFEFAPANGAGMGTACACTTPTGAKGEAMTFTRASSGTCLKGNTTTGVANGDMVTCSTNQPRVMPGGDGTGALGLLVEATRTNSTLQSQAFDNVAWTQQNSGVGAPTVTADQAVAPDGTTTAERIQVPATSAAQYSFVYQSGGCAQSAAVSGSFFVKGNGSSGTVDVVIYSGSAFFTAPCTYVSGSWSLCTKPNVTTIASTTQFGIGNASSINGGTVRGAADIFVWGAQCEVGPYATSYIATTSAAVTRAGELADLPLTPSLPNGFSVAATVVGPSTSPSNPQLHGTPGDRAPGVGTGSATSSDSYHDGTNWRPQVSPASNPTVAPFAVAYAATARWVAFHTGALLNGCKDSTCGAGVSATWTPPTWQRFRLGAYDITNGVVDGVVKQVCFDPSSSRCR